MDSVKQSAALCLLRLYRTSPDLVPMGDWTSRVVHLLNDQHLVNVFGLVSPRAPPRNRFWNHHCESSSVCLLMMLGGYFTAQPTECVSTWGPLWLGEELPTPRGQANADAASGSLQNSLLEGPPTCCGWAAEQDRDQCLLEMPCLARALQACASLPGVLRGCPVT